MTGAGWYTWTIGTPPSWADIRGKLSFSKLDANRTGEDQGNQCYYELHAAAMQLALPGRQGLVPPIDTSSNTARSVGNVVEAILGICTALDHDYLIFSAAKKFGEFLSPDEYFTGIAEALCNFAIHVYRLGCALEYSTAQPGEFAQSYCDAEGHCIAPANYASPQAWLTHTEHAGGQSERAEAASTQTTRAGAQGDAATRDAKGELGLRGEAATGDGMADAKDGEAGDELIEGACGECGNGSKLVEWACRRCGGRCSRAQRRPWPHRPQLSREGTGPGGIALQWVQCSG